MNHMRLTVITVLLAGLSAAVPARTDQTTQEALSTISKAMDTLTKMQDLFANIQKRQQTSVQSAPAGALDRSSTVISIDIQPRANQVMSEDLHETEGNNLKGVPQGEQKLAGASFKIGPKMIHLRGAHAADLPEKVEGIPVNAAVGRLHILHGTGYNLDAATEIAAYIVHYADGASERIPIIYGEDIHDWWVDAAQGDLKRARIVWKGTNTAAEGSQMSLALYDREWINPHPDKQVRSIDCVSHNTECDPFVVALSIEKL